MLSLLPPLLGLALALRPQPQPADRTIRGEVRTADGARVVGATVWLVGTRAPTDSSIAGTTDASGAFRFTLPVSETSALLVRRRGFADVRVTIRGEGGTPKRPLSLAPVTLAPVAPPLLTAVVRDTGAYVGREAQFYRNLAARRGDFVTRADLARMSPTTTSSAMRALRGVTLERSSGGGTFVRLRGRRCFAIVWLDGASMGTRAFDIDMISPQSLVGIEVYAQTGGLPVEYQTLEATSCGVVGLWTSREMGDVDAPEAGSVREPEQVRGAGDVETPARLLEGATFAPVYPAEARASGVGGQVVVEMVVDTTGAVERASVGVAATSTPELATPALRAAERLRFAPAVAGGRPVRQLVHVVAQFQPTVAPLAR
jgi:TonB family protein